MARNKHTKPEVEAAIQYAEEHGWTIKEGGSHAWGRMLCPYNDDTCRWRVLYRQHLEHS